MAALRDDLVSGIVEDDAVRRFKDKELGNPLLVEVSKRPRFGGGNHRRDRQIR